MIIQDKYGMHRMKFGDEIPKGFKLSKSENNLLNILIYLDLLKTEIKKVQSKNVEIWSYFEEIKAKVDEMVGNVNEEVSKVGQNKKN